MAHVKSSQSHDYLLEVTCERSLVKSVTRAVLHAILFQRCLGPLTPRTIELCDLTFVAIDDLDHSMTITNQVEQQADLFTRSFDQTSSRTRKILLSFFERERAAPKAKAPTSWFPLSTGGPVNDQDKPFETFTLEVTVASAASERERSRLAAITKAQLANFQLSLLRFANDNRAHIPAITKEGNPFPFEIAVVGQSEESPWVPASLRRMLSE